MAINKTLLHKGSVKDVYAFSEDLLFEFSDRYSIFDWGKMPDLIESKGICLCQMSLAFFDWLESPTTWKNIELPEKLLYRSSAVELHKSLSKKGIVHHAKDCIDSAGNKIEKGTLSNTMNVLPVDVIAPTFSEGKYNYSFYQKAPTNCLVPLEVIFRFGVPKGSSILKRANNQKYLEQLGLFSEISAGDEFAFPVVEFSTKLESKDRYIDYTQAQKIAGLHDNEFRLLINMTQLLAIKLKEFFESINVKLWDGKFEFAFSGQGDAVTRDMMLVDSIGPDELRLTYENTQLSKEVLRQFYGDSNWFKNLERSKSLAKDRGAKDWKSICIDELKSSPEHLDKKRLTCVSMMYQALCNEISQKAWKTRVFPKALGLKEVSHLIKEL